MFKKPIDLRKHKPADVLNVNLDTQLPADFDKKQKDNAELVIEHLQACALQSDEIKTQLDEVRVVLDQINPRSKKSGEMERLWKDVRDKLSELQKKIIKLRAEAVQVGIDESGLLATVPVSVDSVGSAGSGKVVSEPVESRVIDSGEKKEEKSEVDVLKSGISDLRILRVIDLVVTMRDNYPNGEDEDKAIASSYGVELKDLANNLESNLPNKGQNLEMLASGGFFNTDTQKDLFGVFFELYSVMRSLKIQQRKKGGDYTKYYNRINGAFREVQHLLPKVEVDKTAKKSPSADTADTVVSPTPVEPKPTPKSSSEKTKPKEGDRFTDHLEYDDGRVYDGQVVIKGGKRILEGKGKMTRKNGRSYEGNFVNDVAEGNGEERDKKGNVLYTGNWSKGRRNGIGRADFCFPGGDSYDGEWKDDKPHGRGKVIGIDGVERSATFENGKEVIPGIKKSPVDTAPAPVHTDTKSTEEPTKSSDKPTETVTDEQVENESASATEDLPTIPELQAEKTRLKKEIKKKDDEYKKTETKLFNYLAGTPLSKGDKGKIKAWFKRKGSVSDWPGDLEGSEMERELNRQMSKIKEQASALKNELTAVESQLSGLESKSVGVVNTQPEKDLSTTTSETLKTPKESLTHKKSPLIEATTSYLKDIRTPSGGGGGGVPRSESAKSVPVESTKKKTDITTPTPEKSDTVSGSTTEIGKDRTEDAPVEGGLKIEEPAREDEDDLDEEEKIGFVDKIKNWFGFGRRENRNNEEAPEDAVREFVDEEGNRLIVPEQDKSLWNKIKENRKLRLAVLGLGLGAGVYMVGSSVSYHPSGERGKDNEVELNPGDDAPPSPDLRGNDVDKEKENKWNESIANTIDLVFQQWKTNLYSRGILGITGFDKRMTRLQEIVSGFAEMAKEGKLSESVYSELISIYDRNSKVDGGFDGVSAMQEFGNFMIEVLPEDIRLLAVASGKPNAMTVGNEPVWVVPGQTDFLIKLGEKINYADSGGAHNFAINNEGVLIGTPSGSSEFLPVKIDSKTGEITFSNGKKSDKDLAKK